MRYTVLNGLIAAIVAAAIAGCGGAAPGGGTTASGGTGGTGISAGTITAYGSVVVNGIHFDETGASVVINDTPGAGDHQGLKIGMTVKIKASYNDDGETATASNIEAEHVVEGIVEAVDVPNRSFRVLGQTVYVDDPSFDIAGRIVPNTEVKVEVYGMRDGTGAIHATLIEIDPPDFEEEVRGTVSELDTTAMTFKIGDLTVSYDGATAFDEHGSASDLSNGAIVEVHVDGVIGLNAYATEIEFEDIEDSEFEAGEGETQELEGYIANYNGSAGTFTIGNTVVQVTSTTVLRPSNAVLRNGIPVTARGSTSSGVVIASQIELH